MHKIVFALKITDPDVYARYRASIKPLMDESNVVVLHEYDIASVLHSQDDADRVTRLAVFGFPSREVRDAFFANPVYKNAKKLFNQSTDNFVLIVD